VARTNETGYALTFADPTFDILLAAHETGTLMAGKLMIYAGVVTVLAVTYFGWKLTARGAYESAQYTVLDSAGPFETREYPDLSLATTNMQFELQGNDGSFMRLFRYIGGANDRETKIAMTTPVFTEAEAKDTGGRMGFVIPNKLAQQRIPEPSSDEVEIRKRVGGRFAVIRFAGRIKGDSLGKAEKELRKWMNNRGLIGDGDPEYAGYNPPWTPGPFRRNEILIRLK
jgi:hypothetical protein